MSMSPTDKKLEAIEPAAEVRQVANTVAQLYAGLRQEGFSEQQALYLIGQMMRPDFGHTPGEE